jgi:hypothetical protein
MKLRLDLPRALFLLALLLSAAPSAAYKVFLKDGTSHAAEQKWEVRGNNAIFRLDNGTLMSVPLELVDIDRSEKYNADPHNSRQLESAVVIDREGARPLDLEHLRDRSGAVEGLADQVKQARRATPERTTDRIELRKTPAGFDDFTGQPRLPIVDSELARSLDTTLRAHGLHDFTAYRGTTTERPFIEVTTSTAGEAFAALTSLAQTIVALSNERNDVEALEVLLRTPQRTRAGQFVLDKDNVRDLVSGRIPPSEFFVRFVQF